MAEGEQKPAGITDEQIDSMVAMVEAAEVMGQSLGISASQGLRVMMKSAQLMAALKNGKPTRELLAMVTGASVQ